MADELILNETDRKKLDGIVQQMTTNKEADADIQFVVNDFKTKYGQKKSQNVTTNGANVVTLKDGEPQLEPSTVSGTKAKAEIDKRMSQPITLGDESRQMGIAKGDVFGEIKVNAENAQKALEDINQSRYVRTKKLQEQTVAKQDQVFLEGKKIENLSSQIDFATNLPQYKELTAIDGQLAAMGEPKTKEQINAYNSLVAKRDALLDTDVSQTDEYNATVTIPTFDMPSDDMSEEINRQNQIKDIVNKGKKSFEAKAAYEGKVKLRDVLGVADIKSKELSTSINKYKENAAQIDLNIKEMYNLNKDKLEKVGFTKGFFDGINQVTISNTLADLYLSGDDDQLGKSLENLYMEQATMPKETTVGGDIGTMIGGQVKPMAVSVTASALSPAVGVGAGALYYGRMGIGSGILDVYTTARSQGKTQAEALALAKKQAVVGGVGGVVEGLAGLVTAGGKPVASVVSKSFKEAVKTGLKEAQIDVVTAGLVAAGQNANIQRLGLDRKLHEGVIENMAGEAFFSVGAKVAITGGQKVKGYGTIVNTMAKAPFQDIQAIVDDAVKQGVANEANANQFIQDVQKSAKAQEKLKGVEIDEDVEDDVIDIQKKIDELEASKKDASPAVIGEIDRQINELSTKLKVEAGFPLTPDERKELNLLQTARDSNKEYDKAKLAELEQRQKNNQDGKTKIVTDQPIRVKYKDGRTGLVFVNAEGDVEFVPDGNSAGLVIDKQAGASFRSLANLGFEQVVGETIAEPNSQLLSGDISLGTSVLYKGGKYQIASSKNAPDGVKLDTDGKVRVVYLKGEDGKVIAVGADSVDGKRIIDDANRVIGKGEATPTETAPVQKETKVVEAQQPSQKTVVEPSKQAGSVDVEKDLEAKKVAETKQEEETAPEIKTEKEITLFKGQMGKLNADGTKRTAHPNAEGFFASENEDTAKRYSGEDAPQKITLPKGVTIEEVQVADRNKPMSEIRREEENLINKSKAQVVVLKTIDAKGEEVQYIVKDKTLLEGKATPSDTKSTTEPTQEVVEQTTTVEPTINKEAISKNTLAEVERVKTSAPNKDGDGQTFNLDGTTHDKGGLVIPIVSENLKVSELTPQRIADFVEANKDKLGGNAVKVGIYKFPNGEDVSIDLNVVAPREMREEAIAFGNEAGQESLYDLDTRENVKTGSDGKNPKQFTPQEFKDIANKFSKKQTDGNNKQVSGNRLFNKPLEAAKSIADRYAEKFGLKRKSFEKITRANFDKERAKKIAKAFDEMQDNPNDKDVKAAYEALAKETLAQYEEIIKDGYDVEINNDEPYSSSEQMIEDLRENKRMKIFSTESGFGEKPITQKQRDENPLLRDSGFKDKNGKTLLINDVFRFVHDFFGHAELGNGFGELGEENAWNVHARMFSPLARRAMTTETRGQNSWVNFSGINDEVFKVRDEARKLREAGDIEGANALVQEVYDKMIFAEQKVGLLPIEFSELDASGSLSFLRGSVGSIKYPDVVFGNPKSKKVADLAENFYKNIVGKFNELFDRGLKVSVEKLGGGKFRAQVEYEKGLKPKYFSYPTGKMGEHIVVDAIDNDTPMTSLRHELLHEMLVRDIVEKFERINNIDNSAEAETIDDVQRNRAYNYSLEDVFYERVVEAIEREPDGKDTFSMDTYGVDVTNRLAVELKGKELNKANVLSALDELLDGSNQWLTDKLKKAFSEIDYSKVKKIEDVATEIGSKLKADFDKSRTILPKELYEKIREFTEFFNSEYEKTVGDVKDIVEEKQPTKPTKLETAKAKLAEIKNKRDELAKKKGNLGAVVDPFEDAKNQAKADRELFDAYVEVAKEYIAEVGGDIQAWAEEINEEINDNIKLAWDEASGKKAKVEEKSIFETHDETKGASKKDKLLSEYAKENPEKAQRVREIIDNFEDMKTMLQTKIDNGEIKNLKIEC